MLDKCEYFLLFIAFERRDGQNIRRSGCSVAWLSRLLWEQKIIGSNPIIPTTENTSLDLVEVLFYLRRLVGQMVVYFNNHEPLTQLNDFARLLYSIGNSNLKTIALLTVKLLFSKNAFLGVLLCWSGNSQK